MSVIWDCRRKERFVTSRKGGDYELAVLDKDGNVIAKYWFKMKKPNKKIAERLDRKFEEIKSLLERQDP